MPLKVVKYIRDLVSLKSKTPMIYCKDHPHKLVKNYCPRHKSLHCNRCIIEKHADHFNDQKTVISEAVTRYFNNRVDDLCEIVEDIQRVIA